MERYEQLMKELFTRHPSFQAVGKEAYHPGLEGMQVMDGLMGHPHRKYKCIHVAGTNGKGSVCHLMAAALAAQGYKVGLYTSPHLLDFRERIRIISSTYRLIDKDAVLEFCEKWQGDYDRLGLSFFEITTLMAFDWFARCEVDYAVIETGLGGRLDSTNIIRPELSIITSIGLDHCDILGNTLAEIAFEKAGIIKARVPVVIGEGGPDINPVFEKKVLYTNLPEPCFGGDRTQIMSLLHYAEKEPGLDIAEKEPGLDIRENPAENQTDAFERLLGEMDLPGVYQRANLRTVLCALRVLAKKTDAKVDGQVFENASGPAASDNAQHKASTSARRLRYALAHAAALTGLRGRWERLQSAPEVIGDIGHNAHGLRQNCAVLQAELDKGRRVWMIYGSVSDKDVAAAVSLLPAGADLILTAADNPRALRPEKIFALLPDISRFRSIRVIPTVAEAVDLALRDAAPEDLIYIGGSSYLVAEALRKFER
ncbi:MAG: bifunctional folylpolyglutamate synthase/dihydrofolate synthase [Bacteroidales bacterium]|nr:bifunctional folylpolyglutamate synthase/dihydrofolate synthase [Bacteroidales bacterium]